MAKVRLADGESACRGGYCKMERRCPGKSI